MRRQKQEPFLQLYGILQQYDHATATRRKPWARLFHGFWETAMSSSTSTMYDNVVLCRLQSKSSLGSMSRIETPSEDSKGRPYPNRFRISQSARDDPEGGLQECGAACARRVAHRAQQRYIERVRLPEKHQGWSIQGVSRPISRAAK